MNTAILVKAFTTDKEKGNPAGVILTADHLTENEMIAIAKDLGFSESAFVQTSDKADYKIRFFTARQEVDLCGHATLAAFHVLVTNKLITFTDNQPIQRTMETKVGIFPVICYSDGLIMMEQQSPQYMEPEIDRRLIAKLLSLNEEDFLDYPIQPVSTGATKLMIPIKSLNRLFAIMPNLEGIEKYSRDKNIRGFYPFTFETIDKDADFHTRMFNPLVGIDEDPITGVAWGALACYIRHNNISNKESFVIEQGNILAKGGNIIVDISNGVKIGGYAIVFDHKDIK